MKKKKIKEIVKDVDGKKKFFVMTMLEHLFVENVIKIQKYGSRVKMIDKLNKEIEELEREIEKIYSKINNQEIDSEEREDWIRQLYKEDGKLEQTKKIKKWVEEGLEDLKQKLCNEYLSGKKESSCDRIPQSQILKEIEKINMGKEITKVIRDKKLKNQNGN